MKKELRQRIRQRLEALTPAELQARSTAACRRLCNEQEYQAADVVMIFLPSAYEVDTTSVALIGWNDGKRILAPHVSWEQRRILPFEIHSLATEVRTDPVGVREPVEGMPVPVSEIDLVILPGLAFDEHGNRLGRGRGMYDRFLAHRDFRAVACALAFDEQILDEVPVEPNDRRVHMLVTDSRVLRFERGKS